MTNNLELSDSYSQVPVLQSNAEIDRIQNAIWQGQGGPLRMVLTEYDDRGYYVGSALTLFDRELRRYVRMAVGGDHGRLRLERPAMYAADPDGRPPVAQSEGQRGSGYTPESVDRASLRLLSASSGSANLFLEPVGEMVNLLASQGIIAIVNAMAILGPVRRIRVFLARNAPWTRNAVPSVGQLESLLREPPDTTIDLGDLSLRYSGRPRRVVVFRTAADGSTDLVMIDDGED